MRLLLIPHESEENKLTYRKDFNENLINHSENEIENLNKESLYKNCKFNLKQNRKFQKSSKRLRNLRRNIKERLNLGVNDLNSNHLQELSRFPPNAPHNTTQFLSRLHKNLRKKNDIKNKLNLIKKYKLTKKNSLSSNNLDNNHSDSTKTLSQFSNVINNLNDDLFSSVSENKNESIDQLMSGKHDEFRSNKFDDFENKNFLEQDFEDYDFLDKMIITGSTMKGIVDSFNLSNNKIFSNSLNLEQRNSNYTKFSMKSETTAALDKNTDLISETNNLDHSRKNLENRHIQDSNIIHNKIYILFNNLNCQSKNNKSISINLNEQEFNIDSQDFTTENSSKTYSVNSCNVFDGQTYIEQNDERLLKENIGENTNDYFWNKLNILNNLNTEDRSLTLISRNSNEYFFLGKKIMKDTSNNINFKDEKEFEKNKLKKK